MPNYARKHQLRGNLIYHVFNRANSKLQIFHTKKDFTYFKHLLYKYSVLKALKIYHWVIMSNHYHLLLEIANPEILSSVMAGINKSYTNYYHATYNTVGFLWQGRFKSQPIQKDKYMLACGRYIERNPVKNMLVEYAEDYIFSSAKNYVHGVKDNLISMDPLYSSFGNNIITQQKEYKKFLLAFDSKEEKRFDNFEIPVGDFYFRKRLIRKNGHLFPVRQGRVSNKIFIT